MTVLPVIVRELRASARQPFTYSLRVLGAALLLLAGALFGLKFGFAPTVGRQLFAALHCTLFGAIWVLVPMLTADCISRERREGTLGLLFLTPLKGPDIVVAKGLAQGLRAVTLWLAVLPVLTIPFLVGGVSRAEAALSVMVNTNAMCCALAAGLLASAWSKDWSRALAGAAALAFTFFLALVTAVGWIWGHFLRSRPAPVELNWEVMFATGLGIVLNAYDYWSVCTARAGNLNQLLWVLGLTTIGCWLGLLLALWAAGARTRRAWGGQPPSCWQVWLERTLCTPVLCRSFFRRWMRRKLEHNPIGWLEQRTWSGRLVTWGWVAVLVSVDSAILTDRFFARVANPMQEAMAWLLTASMAASAAGSFRRERETGMLELLLVSPLGENRIILGRLGGLWSQFLPAASLALAVWAYISTFLPSIGDVRALLFFLAAFLTVPVFGLYFSLRCRHFSMAFFSTVVVGLVLPLVLTEAFRALQWAFSNAASGFSWEMRPSKHAAICQGFLALICWDRLFWRLKKRAFPLGRAQAS